MTQTDPPDLKPKNLKQWLSQPWIGPSISLVVLVVAFSSLAVAIATYKRQGDRWAAEASSIFQLNGNVEPILTSDGTRIGNLSFYRGSEPMRVQKLEIISPRDAKFALANGRKALAPLEGAIVLDDISGLSVESAHRFELAIRTPRTPVSDQGEVIEIEGTATGLTGNKLTIVRRAQIMVPPSASKTP
jgi:hypothetical protein